MSGLALCLHGELRQLDTRNCKSVGLSVALSMVRPSLFFKVLLCYSFGEAVELHKYAEDAPGRRPCSNELMCC